MIVSETNKVNIPVFITDQTELFIYLEQTENLGITLPESILNRGN